LKKRKSGDEHVKKTYVAYSFTIHLITPGYNTQLPKVSTGKSPTSNILLRKVQIPLGPVPRNFLVANVTRKLRRTGPSGIWPKCRHKKLYNL